MVLDFQGNIGVNVTYGGDHIPKSPFNVGVAPTLDLGKIKISGLGDSMYPTDLNAGHSSGCICFLLILGKGDELHTVLTSNHSHLVFMTL